ncbi:ATP-binding protein [Demequina sp. SYSU T00192]|uniref:ATP-binding protein n=1 Tax=Demequina litoralis TaxID=3051660 RepID=A0ABT8GA31_9MICO|nr:ATP-binding protein [Demequina sp. SYSU T00192]MDN4475994.1 ATP-binding protein [Demequina sp. SYSU T00192]
MNGAARPARERIQRTLLLAVGIGAVIFGALLAGGSSGFLRQIDQLHTPFGILVVLVGVVVPALYTVLSRVLPIRPLLLIAGTTSMVFMAIQIAWPLLMKEPLLADDATPWTQGINAIHATAAAIAWPRVAGWVYPLVQGPVVAFTQMQVRDDAALEAILDGLGAIIYCLILCGVSIAMISAGDRQDSAAAHAREQAALEASRRTREAEQTRINAIVHDDVMSVLLAASRPTPPVTLAEQARHAIASVESLVSGRTESRDYDPEEFVAVVRSTAATVDASVPVRYAVDGEAPLPAGVVAAFAEATAEALRNALGHGGPGAEPSVECDVTDGSARVVVADHGRGFAAGRVSQRRLGIRVSILERMRTVTGGDADVSSSPGVGTTVVLTWSRP